MSTTSSDLTPEQLALINYYDGPPLTPEQLAAFIADPTVLARCEDCQYTVVTAVDHDPGGPWEALHDEHGNDYDFAHSFHPTLCWSCLEARNAEDERRAAAEEAEEREAREEPNCTHCGARQDDCANSEVWRICCECESEISEEDAAILMDRDADGCKHGVSCRECLPHVFGLPESKDKDVHWQEILASEGVQS